MYFRWMMMRRLYLFLLIVVLCVSTAHSQSKLDSLQKELNKAQGSSRVDVLIELSSELSTSDPKQSNEYANQALKLSGEIKYTKGQSDAYHYIGLYHKRGNDLDKALTNFNKALELRLEINDTLGASKSYNSIGDIYYSWSNYQKAIDNYTEAQKLKELLGDKKGLGISLSKIGNIYFAWGKYDQSLDYYQKALKAFEQLGENNGIATCLVNIGNIYLNTANSDTSLLNQALEYYLKGKGFYEKANSKSGIADAYNNMGNVFSTKGTLYEDLVKKNKLTDTLTGKKASLYSFDQAIGNYQQALKIREELGDRSGMASALNNIGVAYLNTREFAKSLTYFKQSYDINLELNNPAEISVNLYYIGRAYGKQGDYALAIENHQQSLEIALQIKFNKTIISNYEDMARAYFKMGNYRSAYECMDKLSSVKDSTLNEDTKKTIAELTTMYETEKKEQEIKLLTKDKDLAQAMVKQQKMLIYVFIGGLVLIGLILILIVRQYREKKKANHELQQKNDLITYQKQEITDSIVYSRRIQLAILPPGDYIREIFPERFILYKPRDIVSGDFYWLRRIDQAKMTIAAAVDCTGHGVPGALMSMLGVAFLNEIVNRPDINHANQILNALRENIIRSLHQTGKAGEAKDGMDISLCIIRHEENTIEFSGANNPLYMVRDGELQEIKGDKMPIGIYEKSHQPFTNHIIQTKQGDCLYLFTDGLADQFGGPHGKKFMYKKFKQTLVALNHLPMEEQCNILEKEMENWKGDLEQVDDILVMGIKIV